MAGDGSLSKVINTMIELEAYEQENLNLCNINEIKNRLRTPLCIIPCGSTNMFANSIYGTDDAITPLMYLFYGISIRVDLSSVYTSTDKLHSFGFGYSCGFGSTIARYLNRYSKLGQNKVQTSLARGVAKQKHRSFELYPIGEYWFKDS
jgi:diacylglycerol kinase family enzyme